jgi:hypothetical protein
LASNSFAVLPPQACCLIAAFGCNAQMRAPRQKKTGGNRMPHDPHTRRRQIKDRLEQAEKTLSATRNSAGGHSRAVLLHLERQIHASKKDLALLEGQLAADASSEGVPAQENDRHGGSGAKAGPAAKNVKPERGMRGRVSPLY